jgi:hypothetical protein
MERLMDTQDVEEPMRIRAALTTTALLVAMAAAPGLITSVGFPKVQQDALVTADLGPDNFQAKHGG